MKYSSMFIEKVKILYNKANEKNIIKDTVSFDSLIEIFTGIDDFLKHRKQ